MTAMPTTLLPFRYRELMGLSGSSRRERIYDCLIAAGTAAIACVLLREVRHTGLIDGYWTNFGVATLAAASLLWRRNRPEICLSAGLLASLASDEQTVLAVAAYAVARYGGRYRFWVFGTVTVLYVATRSLTGLSASSPEEFFQVTVLTILTPALFGSIARRQQILNDVLHRQLNQVEKSVAHAVRFASLEERTRLAFEVHDNVGHQATVLALHTGVLQQRKDLHPETREAVDAIQGAARQVTHEFRKIVNVLCGPEKGTEQLAERIPCAEFLMSLSRNMAAVGMDVDYQLIGEPHELPEETERLLRRVSQESLTNAAKHAPGAPVTMNLSFSDASVGLEVFTGPSSGIAIVKDSGKLGLRGLKDSVERAGGHFRSGPVPGGGFLVQAHLPYPGTSLDSAAGRLTCP